MKLREIYEQHYKKLLIIPFSLLLFAFIQISVQYAATGDFVNRGISLKGGSTITFEYHPSFNAADIEKALQEKFPKAQLTLRTLTSAGRTIGFALDADAQEGEEINALLTVLKQLTKLDKEKFSVEVTGSSLSESFFQQTITALLIAFLLMGIVVLLYFRTIAPTMAVIMAAFSDIVVTLAIFNLTGIKLSTAGIAAFLMLIGYSVDTDILLSTRMLRRTDVLMMQRIYSSIKTGLTMTGTSLAAILIAMIMVPNEVVRQIMIILFIGLLVDIVMTYIQNVGILRMYLEGKAK